MSSIDLFLIIGAIVVAVGAFLLGRTRSRPLSASDVGAQNAMRLNSGAIAWVDLFGNALWCCGALSAAIVVLASLTVAGASPDLLRGYSIGYLIGAGFAAVLWFGFLGGVLKALVAIYHRLH